LCTQKIHEEYGGGCSELCLQGHTNQNISPCGTPSIAKANIDKKTVSANTLLHDGPGLMGRDIGRNLLQIAFLDWKIPFKLG